MYPTAQLQALVEVAAAGSFTRAAERLGVSQPTVSGSVRSLEQRVGTPLLIRAPRSVRLTPAGRALLPYAERALVLAAEAEHALDRAVAGSRLRLYVSGGEALATYVLPPAIARLQQRLPSLDVGFVVGDEARVLSALRLGEVDAALLTEHTDPGDLDTARFGTGRTVLIARPGPSDDDPRLLADLSRHVLVQRDQGTINRRELDRLLSDAGVEPAGRLEAFSLEAVKSCVEAGLGLAIVPGIAVQLELDAGRLREIKLEDRDPLLSWDFVVGWRRGEEPGRAVTELVTELRATSTHKGSATFYASVTLIATLRRPPMHKRWLTPSMR